MLSQLATVCQCVYLSVWGVCVCVCVTSTWKNNSSLLVCVCVAQCSINVNKFSSFNWNTSASSHEMSKKFCTKFKNFFKNTLLPKIYIICRLSAKFKESTRLTKSFALGQDAYTHTRTHTGTETEKTINWQKVAAQLLLCQTMQLLRKSSSQQQQQKEQQHKPQHEQFVVHFSLCVLQVN